MPSLASKVTLASSILITGGIIVGVHYYQFDERNHDSFQLTSAGYYDRFQLASEVHGYSKKNFCCNDVPQIIFTPVISVDIVQNSASQC